jgi:signal transduction histidine kinase
MNVRGFERKSGGGNPDEFSPETSLISSPTLATAAHELKSPLVLLRQLSLLLQQITWTSERALRLTSDLTRSARLDDALFAMEPINPQALCNEIVQELTPLFTAHGRELMVKARRHPLLLVANRDLLRRIIMNFSDNALYYSEPGSAVELQVQMLQKGKVIRVGVRDFGPALSSDMWRTLQKKIESQSPQSIHARPNASGLGLYIASQFADTMQGKIGAIRHRDGATFYVDLSSSHQLSFL